MGSLLLFDGLKLFARLKADGFPGWNADFCACSRIAPDSGFAGTDVKDTEAPQLDAIALRERFLHALKDRLHGHLSLGLSDPSLVYDFVDDVEFDHKIRSAHGFRMPRNRRQMLEE